MTALADTIKTALAGVVTALDVGGWQVRTRTNRPPATPAFSAWADVALVVTRINEQEEDEETGFYRPRSQQIRVGAAVPYGLGDQLKDENSDVWAITSIESTGYGTTLYNVARTEEHYIGKGGVS